MTTGRKDSDGHAVDCLGIMNGDAIIMELVADAIIAGTGPLHDAGEL